MEPAIKAQLRRHALVLHPVVQAAIKLLERKKLVPDFSLMGVVKGRTAELASGF